MRPGFRSKSWPPLLLVLCGIFAISGSGRADESAPLPNIVLISLDTVRADFLDFRDAETAQNLTALAERGTIFNQAIAGTSWTLPSHAQMFTGTSPPLHGTESNLDMIDPRMPVVTELLGRAGYFTAGYFTVLYLYADYGFGRGFDVYRSAMYEEDLLNRNSSHAPVGKLARARFDRNQGADYITSPHVVSLAKSAIEYAKPGQPLFLFLHLFDAHHDYIPPPPWDTAFDPDYDGDMDGRDYLGNKRVVDGSKQPARQISERDLEHIRSLYRGEIAWVDQAIGEVLDLLKLHDRFDNTLFVVTSDHGEEFLEHNSTMHRRNLFDESIRVPLLIVPPASRQDGISSEIEAQVSLSDITPTLLDFAGIRAPASMTGRSLLPAIQGTPIESRPELISLLQARDPGNKVFQSVLLQGIRMPEYKFLRTTRFQPDQAPMTYARYYDLARDPAEKNPIKDPSNAQLIAGHRRFEDAMDEVRQRWIDEERTPDNERRTRPPETFEAELLVLGYLEAPSGDVIHEEEMRPWGTLAPIPRQRLGGVSDGSSALIVAALGAGLAITGVIAWRLTRRS